jgi:hypothetical protein
MANGTGPVNLNKEIDGFFNKYIGRIVAWALGPVLLAVVPTLTRWINDGLGTDLSDQQLSNVMIAVVTGVAIVLYKWLHNRGEWERAVAITQSVYNQGQAAVEGGVTPPNEAKVLVRVAAGGASEV